METLLATYFSKIFTGTQAEDCYRTFKKLVRKAEYSKSNNSKKLSVLSQIHRFFMKGMHAFGKTVPWLFLLRNLKGSAW